MSSADTVPSLQLKPRQREILRTIALTMLPPDVGFPIAPDDNNVVIPIEKLLSAAGKAGIMGLGALITIFEWAAIIFLPRFKPFTKLSPQDRERYLMGWVHSRIKYRRLMMTSIKALVCLVFFSDAKVKLGVGYDPECLVEMKK